MKTPKFRQKNQLFKQQKARFAVFTTYHFFLFVFHHMPKKASYGELQARLDAIFEEVQSKVETMMTIFVSVRKKHFFEKLTTELQHPLKGCFLECFFFFDVDKNPPKGKPLGGCWLLLIGLFISTFIISLFYNHQRAP